MQRSFGRLDPAPAVVAGVADREAALTARTDPGAPVSVIAEPTAAGQAPALERRGRAWLVWSFLLCPCHLPLSLAALTSVLAGTSAGVVLRDHVWLAAAVITTAWVAGTGYGFRLIRQAERANGACPVRRKP